MALKSLMVLTVAALALTGCNKVAGKLIPGYSREAPAPQPDIDQVSRSDLAKAGQPVLRVKVPSRGLDTLLVVRDSGAGVTSWRTGDGTLFTFRDGILIETRGLGADLMSSSAPSRQQIAAGGSGHGRSYFYIGANDQTMRRDYSCRVEDKGAAEITVQGAGYSTRHVTELCERGEGFRITNEYWLDGEMIRRSLQWAGPELGTLEFQRVID